jgi:hypothetical protein
MGLSGLQGKKLRVALISAFPEIASLEQMLQDELDKNLRAIVGEGALKDIVFKLIKTADAQGWVEDLIRAACDANSENLQLKDIAKELLGNDGQRIVPKPQENHKQKILILTAIPHGLRFDKEIREIEEAIRLGTNRDLFEIRKINAVRPKDILSAMDEEKPQIVHFCGHGSEDGSLWLEDDGGNDKSVTPEALASLFKLHSKYVKCVLLNACHSEKTAIKISQYINYVIGMNQTIKDRPAIAFAQGFYSFLGSNPDNEDLFSSAFDRGIVAIQMENLPQGLIPVLKNKKL